MTPFTWIDPATTPSPTRLAQLRLLQAAAERSPDDSRPRRALAQLLCEDGRAAEALALMERTVADAPEDGPARLDLGALLARNGRFDDAAAAFAQIERGELRQPALLGHGTALRRLGRCAAALPRLREALELDPDSQAAARGVGSCLLRVGDGEALEALARTAIARFGAPSWALAQLCAALSLQERADELRARLDYGRLVSIVDPAPPPPFASIAAFNMALAAELTVEAPFQWVGAEDRRDTVVRSAQQARSPALAPLLAREGEDASALARLTAAFKQEADRYRRETRAGPGHPHHLARPDAVTLDVQAHVLRDEGRIAPHVHPHAWINAVYYAQVPEALGESPSNAGRLCFGAPDHDDARLARCWPARRIEPRPGRLVIFPSFCSHYVTPTCCADPRLTVTFEVEASPVGPRAALANQE